MPENDVLTFWAFIAGALAAGIGLTTLIVNLYQSHLAKEQTRLAVIQTEIVRRQDELLSRRADLTLAPEQPTTSADGMVTMRTRILNIGKRGARDYYWHLWVPVKGFDIKVTTFDGSTALEADEEMTIDGALFRRYRGHVTQPIYPTRSLALARLTILGAKPGMEIPFRWRIIADDGVFPGDEHGLFKLVVTKADPTTIPAPSQASD